MVDTVRTRFPGIYDAKDHAAFLEIEDKALDLVNTI
jgi:hypothetical protein